MAERGEFDLEEVASSHAEARVLGVDQPGLVYGPHRPPPLGNGGVDAEANFLLLLIDFDDNVSSTQPVYFDSLGYAVESFSLRNYYLEVSYGSLDVVTLDWPSDLGWQRAPRPYTFYVGDNYGWGPYPGNSQGMVEDLCNLVDPVVDFSQYDNDSDGYVDGINVVFAGTFDGTPQTIWPHMWSLPYPGIELDGVYAYAYSVQNEYDYNPGDKSAAVMCHEFGHVLGLPDLYDYDYDSYGVGDWCVMAYGVYNGGGWSPSHPSAWCRIELGYTSADTVTLDDWYTLPAVETSGKIYRLWTEGQPGYQYFLVENRRPIGYDSALPSHGTLIWHVDELVGTGNDKQWYPGYTEYGHYLDALEQADGLWQLEQMGNYGDAGDPFPGSTSNMLFNAGSTPDSRDYLAEETGVTVQFESPSADTVDVWLAVTDLGISSGPGDVPDGLPLLSPAISPVTGEEMPLELRLGSPGSVELTVHDVSGRSVARVPGVVLSEGTHLVSVPAAGLPSGVYFTTATITETGASSSCSLVLLR
jgi:immune inhibitor A